MNIFHKLAETAFTGHFHKTGECNIVGDYLNFNSAFDIWQMVRSEELSFYENMGAHEQALALLFIGEMYEHQTA